MKWFWNFYNTNPLSGLIWLALAPIEIAAAIEVWRFVPQYEYFEGIAGVGLFLVLCALTFGHIISTAAKSLDSSGNNG